MSDRRIAPSKGPKAPTSMRRFQANSAEVIEQVGSDNDAQCRRLDCFDLEQSSSERHHVDI